jgi:hypothetical protein
MTKFCLVILLTFSLKMVYGQKEVDFPQGITIDPTIEKLCKSKKDVNSFKIVHFINDSISSHPMLNSISKLPLTSFVSLDKNDTLFTFIGMLVPWGFQIHLKNKGCELVTFVSSKSCKCFKDSLSESNLGYGAAAKPTSLTLVLSKINNINVSDKIYGYLKTNGGDIFHFREGQKKYEKWSFQYEGFFVVEFLPIGK